jgi:hypothetical protein
MQRDISLIHGFEGRTERCMPWLFPEHMIKGKLCAEHPHTSSCVRCVVGGYALGPRAQEWAVCALQQTSDSICSSGCVVWNGDFCLLGILWVLPAVGEPRRVRGDRLLAGEEE